MKKIWKISCASACLSWALAAQNPVLASEPVNFYFEWAHADWIGDLSEQWERAFSHPFSLPSSEVHNCEELMRALNGAPLGLDLTTKAENSGNYHVMICGHVSAMGRLHPAKVPLFDADHLLLDLYNHLDVTSLPWSVAQRLKQADGVTLKQLKMKKPDKDEVNYMSFSLQDRLYLIHPVMMGALSEGGPQVVYAEFEEDQDHPKFYRQAGVVLLVRDQPKGMIKATPVVLKPLEYYTAPLSMDNIVREPGFHR